MNYSERSWIKKYQDRVDYLLKEYDPEGLARQVILLDENLRSLEADSQTDMKCLKEGISRLQDQVRRLKRERNQRLTLEESSRLTEKLDEAQELASWNEIEVHRLNREIDSLENQLWEQESGDDI